ncbi:MAG: CxxxxCH/CxxCH domain-containing protein [Bacteroidota bacterium]
MKQIISTLIIVFSLFLAFGCSEINEDINTPEDITHHPEGFGKASSEDFHGNVFVKNNWSFNLTKCQSCHAADYSGGTADVSCLDCHTQPAGPEACNTCHGEFANPKHIAPPNDLEGNSDKGSKGVGAHYIHVHGNEKSTNIGCFECHQSTTSDGAFVHAHIDGNSSEMEFGSFSHPDSIDATPSYNSDLTCSNTYCHGAFKFGDIEGNNYNPLWNSTTETDGQCGTCHGEIDEDGNLITPLPTGHFGDFSLEQCFMCHSSVVNDQGEIIDPLKHINKQIDK